MRENMLFVKTSYRSGAAAGAHSHKLTAVEKLIDVEEKYSDQ